MIPEDLQNLTDEQIIELGRQANLEELRQNRNRRLEETDWTQNLMFLKQLEKGGENIAKHLETSRSITLQSLVLLSQNHQNLRLSSE